MSRPAKITAPPYHVQSTAAKLRNNFPYFPHHDSVSALWSHKWRVPCLSGVYPFTEAKVEDFNPIFSEVAKISDDDPGILYRPDDYAKPVFQAKSKSSIPESKHSFGVGTSTITLTASSGRTYLSTLAKYPCNLRNAARFNFLLEKTHRHE